MTERPDTKIAAFASFAQKLQALSTCKAKPCGCVAFPADFSAVYAIGYNGPPRGRPNDWCSAPSIDSRELARCGCIHAEANLMTRLGAVRNAILYCTTMPCPHCAGLIANSGKVAGVIWGEPYWTDEGVMTLKCAAIFCSGPNPGRELKLPMYPSQVVYNVSNIK